MYTYLRRQPHGEGKCKMKAALFIAFDCSANKDGDYDNPDNPCSEDYVSCSGGESIFRKCPMGLVYDLDNNLCHEAEFVVACGGTNTESAPDVTRPPASGR